MTHSASNSTRRYRLVKWGLFAFVTLLCGGGNLHASDERLSNDERILVSNLVERGMPELLEPLLDEKSPLLRIHYARACRVAAEKETEATVRAGLQDDAERYYDRLVELANRTYDESKNPADRFRIADWQVEFGDFLLRDRAGPHLDRYELTCGLEFDRDAVMAILKRAAAAYRAAGKIIDEMSLAAKTSNNDEFLLTGLAGKIEPLAERQRLNAAWCSLYLAMLAPSNAPEREGWLGDALTEFDVTVTSRRSSTLKYNALLGLGLSLRERGRFDYANNTFEQVSKSTQGQGLTLRALYERAKSFWRDGRYREARQQLQALSQLELTPDSRFYVQLSDLAIAYTYIHDSRRTNTSPDRKRELEAQAEAHLVELAKRGGAWPDLVRPYLAVFGRQKRELGDLNDLELSLAATRMMENQQFAEAAQAWQLLLQRGGSNGERHRGRFNLAVCWYQSGQLRQAAELFLDEAQRDEDAVEVKRVYEYAYSAWKQLAAQSSAPDDYLELARAAELLSDRQPDHASSVAARWVAALALEEAGRHESARSAYERIDASSPFYPEARRNIARSQQRVYDDLPADTAVLLRNRIARETSAAWQSFASFCAARLSDKPGDAAELKKLQDWHDDAIISAAQLLASEDTRDFEGALALLEAMPRDARALGLRIRCLQALGRSKDARQSLQDFVEGGVDANLGSILLQMSAEMQAEILKLSRYGRDDEARELAGQTIPTLRYLIRWLERNPSHQQHVPVAQLALIDTLLYAEKLDDARDLLDDLIVKNPNSGSYLRRAAQLRERMANRARGDDVERLQNEAEALWKRLLEDGSLRTSAPVVYWEARYYWLKHQLRHGQAAKVLKGIRSEKAWYPDLGGPPWQGRLLELEARAARMAPSGS